MSNTYISDKWKGLLKQQNLVSFDDWWKYEVSLVDAPNRQGKKGWSQVGMFTMQGPNGENEILYVKKQSHYKKRSFNHFIVGEATLASEQRNILRFQALGIPALESIFFHDENGGERAVLVTRGLKNYVPLDAAEEKIDDKNQRKDILKKVANTVALLHNSGIAHFNLYPKHIFINLQNLDVRFIDLETARRHLKITSQWIRDLEVLNRRSVGWTNTERWYFWLEYLKETQKLSTKKSLAKKILARTLDKRERA